MFGTFTLVEFAARFVRRATVVVAGAFLAAASPGCSSRTPGPPGLHDDWLCEVPQGTSAETAPQFVTRVGCSSDFELLSATPSDASLPGARSIKVVLDLIHGDQLYFQNTAKYDIHWKFVHNSKGVRVDANETLFPDTLDHFNPQYTQPLLLRQFLLASVTYYPEPDVWALEIAPYDTSTPDMIEKLYAAVQQQSYFGPLLAFHPTSEDVEETARGLDSSVKVKTTAQIYEGIRYQPLNQGRAVGTVKIMKAADLADAYVSARDIVVLDSVPNDIEPTAAIVTEDFQTPLSHINVLARTRGTPNMALVGATTNAGFVALKDKLAAITVGADGWKLEPATQQESDDWWEENKPPQVVLKDLDLSVTDLRDIGQVTVHTDTAPYVTYEAIEKAILAFGAKSANYSVFDSDPLVPHKPAFAIPVYFYRQFMEQNGIFARVEELKVDPAFASDAAIRDAKLLEVRNMVLSGAFSEEFTTALKAKLDQDFPGLAMRFRSSTNAEDLAGFPCAGCYDSHTGDPARYGGDQLAASLDAIRKTWATAWNKRTYEERELHGIDHAAVAMGLLVHGYFPDEEANGVAITNNIFDLSGTAPGFYVNVQYGGLVEVVHPPPGVTSDSFLYIQGNASTSYYTRTNLPLPDGRKHVLGERQIFDLAVALKQLHERFAHAYQTDVNEWYAIDCEFKFDDDADKSREPTLYIKQARPYPKSGSIQVGD